MLAEEPVARRSRRDLRLRPRADRAEDGAVLLRIGKRAGVDEAEALAPALTAAGIPIAARMEAPATADGGDMFWLDDDDAPRRTRLPHERRRHRGDPGGAPDAEVMAFDLPHLRGRAEVLHLMSLVSPLAEDLVVAYPPLLPVRLVELFEQRGIAIVEVPEAEFDSMGSNVLALAPRVALALERNVETRRRLERAGVRCSRTKARSSRRATAGRRA